MKSFMIRNSKELEFHFILQFDSFKNSNSFSLLKPNLVHFCNIDDKIITLDRHTNMSGLVCCHIMCVDVVWNDIEYYLATCSCLRSFFEYLCISNEKAQISLSVFHNYCKILYLFIATQLSFQVVQQFVCMLMATIIILFTLASFETMRQIIGIIVVLLESSLRLFRQLAFDGMMKCVFLILFSISHIPILSITIAFSHSFIFKSIGN